MKVAFSTQGESLDAPMDSRFGRAPKFLVFDTQTRGFVVVDNEQNLNAAQGAGIQAAATVVLTGAGCVVTGHCGPKAFRVLSIAGVKVCNCALATVADALAAYEGGQLQPAVQADVEGHW